jgi:serine/threonine protein kinase
VNPERWKEVNALFHALVDLDEAGRAKLLAETAATDPTLANEVRSLLGRHSSDATFLEAPLWQVAAELIVDDEPSLVGKQVGSYTVLEEIGRGGMGVVYAARDERLGRVVALKALPPTSDGRHRDRLAREARAAASFTHEAIATVYALEEIDGELYIASELVRGQTLREELASGPLAPGLLVPTLTEIASGLAAAHTRGIIHRDLKPENIIRRTDGHIKILDFGLARIDDPLLPTMTRLTEPGTAPGTPGYMAPEQISGDDLDARVDLFAFGVLAWELATGEHPFGSNPAAMLARMAEGRPATLSRQLSVPGLDPVVRRCLRAVPAERYPSADVLLEELRRLLPSSGSQPIAVAPLDSASGFWWWQFHQRMMTVVDSVTPILAWLVRPALGSWRTQIFLAVLALATAAVTLRLNLLFTARVHAASLQSHRHKLFRWIAAAEATIAVLLLVIAAAIADPWPVTAAILVSLAIVMAASLALIEPATTAAAGLDNGPGGQTRV